LLLAAFVVLVACGSDGAPDVSPPGDGGRRNEATEWYLRAIADDGRRIDVVYTISGVASDCERKGEARAEESADEVVVTAFKSVTLDRNRACTEELGFVEESVTLGEPLGERALVGCRPGKLGPSEDRVCRDLERSREHGIFERP
jgi:hypothetical protein